MNIVIGSKTLQTFTVDRQSLDTCTGSGDLGVLATSALLAFIESTAKDLVSPMLDSHSEIATSMANISHLFFTREGDEVSVLTEIIEVSEQRISLESTVTNPEGKALAKVFLDLHVGTFKDFFSKS